MTFNYLKTDKKEKRNVEIDYTIPYRDLLDVNKENERKSMIDFFKSNGVALYNCMHASDIDYEVFVGCMEIYKKTGINYFDGFSYLKINYNNKDLEKGKSL